MAQPNSGASGAEPAPEQDFDETGSVGSDESGPILVYGYHLDRLCAGCLKPIPYSEENMHYDMCPRCRRSQAHELEEEAHELRAQSGWSPTCAQCIELKENCEMCEDCQEQNNNND